MVAFVRPAADRVDTGLPISNNQVISGAMIVLGQAFPFAVAWSGPTFGPRPTWGVLVAGVLLVAFVIGFILFGIYEKDDGALKSKQGWKATAKATWTPWVRKAALVNFLSGWVLAGPQLRLTTQFHLLGLPQTEWFRNWAFAAAAVGAIMMLIVSRVVHQWRDRGLYVAAIITAIGAAFLVVTNHQTSGWVLILGIDVINLGANMFEGAIYGERALKALQVLGINSFRALAFGLGGVVALSVGSPAYTWVALAVSIVGLLLTVLWRKEWVMDIKHPLKLRSFHAVAAIALALGTAVLMIITGGIIVAWMLGGLTLTTAVVLSIKYILNRIAAIEARTTALETEHNRNAEREQRLSEAAENTREAEGLDDLS
ncbi:hypothetical protein KSF_036550 [Reticulibacter mediterranei]|uniref:Uncharacterized protein n=1 Tax=Reticulibacter mediterranei TaxID=2778369 RepID=A0A8J3N156_9CHLR|nr:hypothetical protein [Reticulibacter mediterranei]GHO93607.1 hypothetical protein KSF_036550 [Reticulibacter mediterranei]